MSYVTAAPEALTAAAADLAGIGSKLEGASVSAAGPTTNLLAAAEDEVSTAIAALFGSHAQQFQALNAQAAAFHTQFTQALSASAGSYRSDRGGQRQTHAERAQRGEYSHRGAGRAPLIGNGADATTPGATAGPAGSSTATAATVRPGPPGRPAGPADPRD